MRPADLPEILSVPDAKGEICTLASLEATIVIWPEGDESRNVQIKMPDRDVNVSTVQNCFNNPSSSVKPLLVVTWSSSFQLCFYISKVSTNTNITQFSHVIPSSVCVIQDFQNWILIKSICFHLRTKTSGVWIKSSSPSTLQKFRSVSSKVRRISITTQSLVRDFCYLFFYCPSALCLFQLFFFEPPLMSFFCFTLEEYVDQTISGRSTPLSSLVEIVCHAVRA